jgi:benzoate/toluate 1,2-dioxygenase beta subunit
MKPPALEAVRGFVEREARLLDDCRWAEWNALFAEDGVYWMPASPRQPDAVNHVSLIHDTPLLRAVRIERFANANAFSLQPRPRAVRMVAGVAIESADAGIVIARSTLFAVQYADERKTIFAGHVLHHLVSDGESFRIRLKRVELIDCDGAQNDIHFYL